MEQLFSKFSSSARDVEVAPFIFLTEIHRATMPLKMRYILHRAVLRKILAVCMLRNSLRTAHYI